MNMRTRLWFSLATILATSLSLSACNSRGGSAARTNERTPEAAQSTEAQATPSDGVRRITISKLRDALEKGEAVAIDVRGSVEYNLGHIKGARSVPLGLIASQSGDLPRDKLIVAYCA